jgi:hypothetical protein
LSAFGEKRRIKMGGNKSKVNQHLNNMG